MPSDAPRLSQMLLFHHEGDRDAVCKLFNGLIYHEDALFPLSLFGMEGTEDVLQNLYPHKKPEIDAWHVLYKPPFPEEKLKSLLGSLAFKHPDVIALVFVDSATLAPLKEYIGEAPPDPPPRTVWEERCLNGISVLDALLDEEIPEDFDAATGLDFMDKLRKILRGEIP